LAVLSLKLWKENIFLIPSIQTFFRNTRSPPLQKLGKFIGTFFTCPNPVVFSDVRVIDWKSPKTWGLLSSQFQQKTPRQELRSFLVFPEYEVKKIMIAALLRVGFYQKALYYPDWKHNMSTRGDVQQLPHYGISQPKVICDQSLFPAYSTIYSNLKCLNADDRAGISPIISPFLE